MAVNGGGGLRQWPRRYRRSRTKQYLVSHVDWPQHRSNNDARLDVSPSPSSRTWRTASGGCCRWCGHHMENSVLFSDLSSRVALGTLPRRNTALNERTCGFFAVRDELYENASISQWIYLPKRMVNCHNRRHISLIIKFISL